MSAVRAIIGDKFIPGLLDHFLARVGYGAQQTDESVESHRPNNLYESLPGDYGARGRFDDRSVDYSVQAWANRHRGWLALGLSLAAFSSLYLKARRSP
jgi:hypothetical protein